MNIVIMSPIRLLGEGLAACLSNRPPFAAVYAVHDLKELRDQLNAAPAQVVLVDVTQGIDVFDMHDIAENWRSIPLVALGLHEDREQVIKCARAGFTSYVARETTIEGLAQTLRDAVQGRVVCPPDIVSGLLRELSRKMPQESNTTPDPGLTPREREVLALVGDGLSNKEIGKSLCLSVATIKHHVHRVLFKLGLCRRAQAMRKVRDSPWLGKRVK